MTDYVLENNEKYILRNVHSEALCLGRPCPIHNKTDHSMRSFPQHFRSDTGLMERICPDRGIGHPDPDALFYYKSRGIEGMGIHGCDGCCREV